MTLANRILQVPATTAAAELKYERCTNAVEMLAKDEHMRVLRLKVLSLQGQVDDLNEMMWKETERGDEAEANIETWQASAEKANKDLERTLNQLRLRTREMDIIKVSFKIYNLHFPRELVELRGETVS